MLRGEFPFQMQRIQRPTMFVAAGAVLAALLCACGGKAAFQPIEPVATTCAAGQIQTTTGGDAVTPASGVKGGKRYLFRCDSPPVAVRASSRALVAAVPQVVGLRAIALPSTSDASALYMTEEAPGKAWGALIDGGRKAVLEAFAKDPSAGDWLVMVTDVVVTDGPDPSPPNAYRWTRQQVQDYATCGIPDQGRNDCSTAFFAAAEPDNHILLAETGGPPRGQ
jgi:hypothetical protein